MRHPPLASPDRPANITTAIRGGGERLHPGSGLPWSRRHARSITVHATRQVPCATRVGSFSAQRTLDCAVGGSCRGSQAGAARFPGVLLSRGTLRACCYRSGSAAAARSRATDPAATRAHPAAILGLRRCTARATQGTWITAFGASTAIASTVSRRGQRRPHHRPMTIPATVEASLYWGCPWP
jgi:hypothetical protein